MIKDFLLPDLGEGIESAEVSEILVSSGDEIEVNQTLFVLESDKASMEIPAEVSGVVKEVLIKVGDEIKTGQLLLKIETQLKETKEKNTTIKEKVGLSSMDNETTTTNTQVLVEDSSYSEGSKSLASPGVRKLARELGIQLSSIKSTGKGGRLTKEDLLTFIKAKIASGGLKDTDKIPKVDFSAWGELETKKLTRVNKITGQRLQQAWQTIPHVVQYDEADITDLNSYRKEIKERESKKGVKITFLPFLMKACVKTLEKHPTFNSSLDIEENNLIIKATTGASVPNIENGYLIDLGINSIYIEPHGFLDTKIKPRNIDLVITPVIDFSLPIAGKFIKGKTVLPQLLKLFNPKAILASTTGGDITFTGMINNLIKVDGSVEDISWLKSNSTKFINPEPLKEYKFKCK